MNIFDFNDHIKYLKKRTEGLPKKGRGEFLRMAEHLRIHPTVISQIFSGLRDFSEEQAIELAEYLNLTSAESSYLRLLVRRAGASTAKLREALAKEIAEAQRQSKVISGTVLADQRLSEQDRTVFYSSWIYSAIRLFCSTKEAGCTVEEVSQHFHLSRARVVDIMNFLTLKGLLTYESEKYKMGAQVTFVEKGTPQYSRHMINWRHKAMQAQEQLTDYEMMFTAPFSISRKDFDRVRSDLQGFLKQFSQTVRESDSEEIACLNIDLFFIK